MSATQKKKRVNLGDLVHRRRPLNDLGFGLVLKVIEDPQGYYALIYLFATQTKITWYLENVEVVS